MTAELTSVRDQLEEEKLRLQINALKLPWWKRPAYVGGLAPAVLGTVGLAWAIATGYFDDLARKLELEKKSLQIDIGQLEVARRELTIDITKFSEEKRVLAGSLDNLRSQQDALTKELAASGRKVLELTADIQNRQRRMDHLQRDVMTVQDQKRQLESILADQDRAVLALRTAGSPCADAEWNRCDNQCQTGPDAPDVPATAVPRLRAVGCAPANPYNAARDGALTCTCSYRFPTAVPPAPVTGLHRTDFP